MKNRINLVSLIFVFLTIWYAHPVSSYTKSVFIGSIQFPHTLQSVPAVRVFCGGNKISTEKNDVSKRITFTIPEDKRRTQFPLIITENVQFEVEEDSNTIKCLKIPGKQKYKFYMLELLKVEKPSNPESEKPMRVSHLYNPATSYTYEWLIHEEKGPLTDGRIPDDSIVVYYKPAYIQELKGGNAFELPRIIIKKDIVQLAGSEEKLHDTSKSLILSSLDLNAIHANILPEVTQESRRTVITLVT